jgi:hypothetical protein
MTGSLPRSDLDLARGIPTTRADIEALRRIRAARRLSTEDYLRALAQLPAAPTALTPLRRRRSFGGEPFRLRAPG